MQRNGSISTAELSRGGVLPDNHGPFSQPVRNIGLVVSSIADIRLSRCHLLYKGRKIKSDGLDCRFFRCRISGDVVPCSSDFRAAFLSISNAELPTEFSLGIDFFVPCVRHCDVHGYMPRVFFSAQNPNVSQFKSAQHPRLTKSVLVAGEPPYYDGSLGYDTCVRVQARGNCSWCSRTTRINTLAVAKRSTGSGMGNMDLHFLVALCLSDGAII